MYFDLVLIFCKKSLGKEYASTIAINYRKWGRYIIIELLGLMPGCVTSGFLLDNYQVQSKVNRLDRIELFYTDNITGRNSILSQKSGPGVRKFLGYDLYFEIHSSMPPQYKPSLVQKVIIKS
jgi:hypothetical protein